MVGQGAGIRFRLCILSSRAVKAKLCIFNAGLRKKSGGLFEGRPRFTQAAT